MELITGGNLFDMIKKTRQFSEVKASNIIQQLCKALNYMHGLNIMHRDLKPENLMCEKGSDDNITIKLTDFGFATFFSVEQPESLALGSPLYMAPELCMEIEYDNKVDVWSTGVITYALLTGSAPFSGRSKSEIYDAIINKEPNYARLGKSSAAAREFIQACLRKEPTERPSMEQLLQYEWFKNF